LPIFSDVASVSVCWFCSSSSTFNALYNIITPQLAPEKAKLYFSMECCGVDDRSPENTIVGLLPG